ncbi:MAG: sigma-70 family RNA polymerase sigma factor [Deltaproteobacteria bacterium]|nr:MAG: sigma-70 family RNA polymerase sigma factor [Deltaproteobacteria bacterium]
MNDDLALLTRWRDGDQRAGEALCARYFDAIYRFFEYKIPEEADDLTQQTFLACMRARSQFRGQSTFRTYLYSIARNELLMRLRRGPKGERVDLDVSSLDELVSSPSKKLGQQQELAQIRAALHKLPVEQALLLEFHYWHDLDAAELAELLESTPGTIRVRLLRARRALRAKLVEAGVAGTGSDPLSVSLREPDDDSDR